MLLFSSSVCAQTDLTGATVTLSTTQYEYDGTEKTPTVTGIRKGTKRYNSLVAGTDYDLSYTNNIHAGIATATLTFKGDYTGVATKDFTINPKDLSEEVTLELAKYEYVYDGTAKEPAVSDLHYGEQPLVSGVDYDLTYKNNINPGTATATATFKGDYIGTAKKDFKIIDGGTVPPTSLIVNYYDRTLESPVEVEKTYSEFLTLQETYKNAIAITPQGFNKWSLDKKNIVVKGENAWTDTCDIFSLTDKEDFYSTVSFTARTVTYSRDLVEGNNTVCLPFGISETDIPENSALYGFFVSDDEKNQIYFLSAESVYAGYSCLLRTAEACTWNVELSNVKVEKLTTTATGYEGGGFYGTYVLTSDYRYSENNPCYGLRNSDNVFAPLANTLSPFRACIKIHDVNALSAKSFRIYTFDSITEIEDIKAQNKKVQFNGKFVKNGKIVIVKKGKTYNISGAEMK